MNTPEPKGIEGLLQEILRTLRRMEARMDFLKKSEAETAGGFECPECDERGKTSLRTLVRFDDQVWSRAWHFECPECKHRWVAMIKKLGPDV